MQRVEVALYRLGAMVCAVAATTLMAFVFGKDQWFLIIPLAVSYAGFCVFWFAATGALHRAKVAEDNAQKNLERFRRGDMFLT